MMLLIKSTAFDRMLRFRICEGKLMHDHAGTGSHCGKLKIVLR